MYKTLLKFSAVAVCLIIMPAVLLYKATYWLEDQENSLAMSAAREEVSRINSHLSRLATPESLCEEIVGRVIRGLRWDSDLEAVVSKSPQGTLALYLFDQGGRRIVRKPFESDKRAISEHYLALLRQQSSQNPATLSDREMNLAQTFSGSPESVEFLASRQGKLVQMSEIGGSGLAGWFRVFNHDGTEGFLIAFVNLAKIPEAFFPERAVERIAALAGDDYQFGWINMNQPGQRMLSSGNDFAAPFLKLLRMENLNSVVAFRGRLIAVNDIHPGFRMVSARFYPEAATKFPRIRAMIVAVLIFILMIYSWNWLFHFEFFLSIRWQIGGIFAASTLIGVIVLMVFASLYRDARLNSMLIQSRSTAVSFLEQLDGSFSLYYSSLLNSYRSMVNDLQTGKADLKEIEQRLNNLHKGEKLVFGGVFDVAGGYLVGTYSRSETSVGNTRGGRYRKLLSNIAAQVISKFNSSELTGKRESNSENMLSVILQRPIEDMIKHRSKFRAVQLMNEMTTNFIDVVIGKDGLADMCVIVVHDTEAMSRRYLSDAISRVNSSKEFSLLVFPKSANPLLQDFGGLSSSIDEDVRVLLDTVAGHGRIHHREGRLNQERVVLSVFPGKILQNYYLILATPVAPVEEYAQQVMRNFAALSVGAVVFAGMLAWLLSKAFLLPVRCLSVGIDALSSGIPSRCVQIGTNDELQQVGDCLNSIIEGASDLESTRRIQENLVPEKPLNAERFSVFGWSRPGAQSITELYDYFTMTDGKTAFFVVGVDGRGISGTLILAMTRMAVRLFLQYHSASTGEVMGELDRFFRYSIRAVFSLNIFIGVVDPDSRKLFYSGAGRVSALSSQDGESFNRLNIPYSPMGVSKQPKYQQESLELKELKRLVVCTRSVSDCLNRLEEKDDPMSESYISSILKGGNLEEIEGAVRRGLIQTSQDKVGTADLTVLVFEAIKNE